MLLDTGADVSLIPKALIPLSIVEAASFRTFQLVGFDGSSRSFQSIELQVVFQGKRFTGEYCLIDDEIGILDRDVMNQISIILDAPNLVWDLIQPTD